MLFRLIPHLLVIASFADSSVEAEIFGSEGQEQDHQRDEIVNYGVDVSFPTQHAVVSDNYAWLPHNIDPAIPCPERYKYMAVQPFSDRQAFYREYIDGCLQKFGNEGDRCIQREINRVAMSLRQPQSMKNYTEAGFKKMKAPNSVFKLIKDFWEEHKDKATEENWGVGNTYTNNWASPTYLVNVQDPSLRGGGKVLKRKMWDAARKAVEEWTGEELEASSIYGIRVYHEGSVLATHVDRHPLVSGVIINVAQDVDEPWPLEVYGHDGRARNVTMEPGDMILYESHSVLHGRPFPLKGRFMANMFIHFVPVERPLDESAKADEDANTAIRETGGHEVDEADVPHYVLPGSPEEDHWREKYQSKKTLESGSTDIGSTLAHLAAQGGDMEALAREVTKQKEVVHANDKNGWTGASGGHLEVVKYLVSNGADLNARTGGSGGTALYWAKQNLDEDHPVISFLESVGGLDIGPDL